MGDPPHDRKTAARNAVWRMLDTGHCAQASLYNMHRFLQFEPIDELITAVAGLAGGLGHQGAACGTLVGGALVLGLSGDGDGGTREAETARACMRVNEFVRTFTRRNGSTLCEEITEVDFEDDRQVRKHVLLGTRKCLQLNAQAASMLVDIQAKTVAPPEEHFLALNRDFSEKGFCCAHAVLREAMERTGRASVFNEKMLIPLNGGIGYTGSSCAALIGGCLVIGLLRGGDTSKGGKLETLGRMARTFRKGSSAYKTPDISPAAEALVQCSELFDWFEDRFASHLCGKITGVNFEEEGPARSFFSTGSVSGCISMAKQTARKALELASQPAAG